MLQVPQALPEELLPAPQEQLEPQQAPSRVRSEERCYPAPTTHCRRADP